jgi:hypothetical protein
MLNSHPILARRGLALRLLALSFFSVAAVAALGSGGGCSSDCTDFGQECIVASTCVEKCGGPIITQGCCPCGEGTFERSACDTDGGDEDGGDGG